MHTTPNVPRTSPFILQIGDADQDIPESCTLEEFFDANEDEDIRFAAACLAVGESFDVGGGSAPLITIRRLI